MYVFFYVTHIEYMLCVKPVLEIVDSLVNQPYMVSPSWSLQNSECGAQNTCITPQTNISRNEGHAGEACDTGTSEKAFLEEVVSKWRPE